MACAGEQSALPGAGSVLHDVAMLEFDTAHRGAGRRFVRYASAVTQAEIRRLSRAQRPQRGAGDAIATVQHELLRLSHPAPTPLRRRRRPPGLADPAQTG